MKLTAKDAATARQYGGAKPKQLGNLHERMKFLLRIAAYAGLESNNAVWQAIHDLATEVRYHEPAKPPYGRRTFAAK